MILHLHRQDGWLRLPAVAFGIAEIPLLYAVGRRLVGDRPALIACLVMAVAVPEIEIDQIAFQMGNGDVQ
jgi:4-amino-4-deoxy-L-arabinose transferase-like glycosyltransferase